jgi:hypothetical protein
LARNRLIARQIIITGELAEHLKEPFIFVIVDFFVKVIVLWLKQAYSQQAKSDRCFASSKHHGRACPLLAEEDIGARSSWTASDPKLTMQTAAYCIAKKPFEPDAGCF